MIEQLVEALQVLNNLDADINFLNTNELEDMVDAALAAGQQALEQTQVEAEPEWNDENVIAYCIARGISAAKAFTTGATQPQAAEPAPAKVTDLGRYAFEPAPSTAGERDRTIVSLPIPASAADLKSDIAELIQSHKYKGLRSIEVLGVFQFLGAEIISGSNS